MGTAVYPIPDIGYTFFRWSDMSVDDPRTDGPVTGDITVTAFFSPITPLLTYLA